MNIRCLLVIDCYSFVLYCYFVIAERMEALNVNIGEKRYSAIHDVYHRCDYSHLDSWLYSFNITISPLIWIETNRLFYSCILLSLFAMSNLTFLFILQVTFKLQISVKTHIFTSFAYFIFTYNKNETRKITKLQIGHFNRSSKYCRKWNVINHLLLFIIMCYLYSMFLTLVIFQMLQQSFAYDSLWGLRTAVLYCLSHRYQT